jgi:hypothetical protein
MCRRLPERVQPSYADGFNEIVVTALEKKVAAAGGM